MKSLLFILITAGACGYGAYTALQTQTESITAAEIAQTTATRTRDELRQKNAAFAPNVSQVKATLAALPTSPLPAADAAVIAALDTRRLETETKLAELQAANAEAIKAAEAAATETVTTTKSDNSAAIAAVVAETTRLKSEITAMQALAKLMREAITAEEAATRGRVKYTSTATGN